MLWVYRTLNEPIVVVKQVMMSLLVVHMEWLVCLDYNKRVGYRDQTGKMVDRKGVAEIGKIGKKDRVETCMMVEIGRIGRIERHLTEIHLIDMVQEDIDPMNKCFHLLPHHRLFHQLLLVRFFLLHRRRHLQ